MQKSDAGDTPKRLLIISKTGQKFEIKSTSVSLFLIVIMPDFVINIAEVDAALSHYVLIVSVSVDEGGCGVNMCERWSAAQ
jgi:hypothetical protein